MSPSRKLMLLRRAVAFFIISLSGSFGVSVHATEKDDVSAFAALQMKLLLADQQEDVPKPVEMADLESNEQFACNTHSKKVASLLAFIPQSVDNQSAAVGFNTEAKQAIKELLGLSKSRPFDAECAVWRHDIVQRFTQIRYKNLVYKQDLYATLVQNRGGEINTLALEVLNYSLLFGPLSVEEWGDLMTSFQYTTHQDLKRILDAISTATAAEIQTTTIFERQIDDLVMLAQQRQLGQPINIKESYVIGLLLANIQRVLPQLFQRLYVQYHQRIDKPVRLEKYVRGYIEDNPSVASYQLLSLFLADVERSDITMNPRDANKLFNMLNALRPELADSQMQPSTEVAVWQQLLLQHRQVINDVLRNSRANAIEKQYWIDFYQKNPAKVTQLTL